MKINDFHIKKIITNELHAFRYALIFLLIYYLSSLTISSSKLKFIQSIIGVFPSLEYLDLSDNPDLDFKSILDSSNKFPSLKTLILDGISNMNLNERVKKFNKLNELSLKKVKLTIEQKNMLSRLLPATNILYE